MQESTSHAFGLFLKYDLNTSQSESVCCVLCEYIYFFISKLKSCFFTKQLMRVLKCDGYIKPPFECVPNNIYSSVTSLGVFSDNITGAIMSRTLTG